MAVIVNEIRNIMLRTLLLAIILFLNTTVYSQTKVIYPQLINNKDTSFWFKLTLQDLQKVGLKDLRYSTDKIHIRFWDQRQVIDLYSNDSSSFNGEIISFINGVPKGKKKSKLFKQENILSPSDALNMYELFDSLRIFQIPIQDSIKDWNNGSDGVEYIFEFSTPSFYSYKTYWTPEVQENVVEAKQIYYLIKRLNSDYKMHEKWQELLNSLPLGHYSYGGVNMIKFENRKK